MTDVSALDHDDLAVLAEVHRDEQVPKAVTLLTAALAWQAAGFSVVRVSSDGTKKPLGTWKAAMTAAADAATITSWFTEPRAPGVGLVMGAVSGHAEMFELEARAVCADLGVKLGELMQAHGLEDLWTRLRTGYVDISPTGGLHFVFRVIGGVGPNTKLARCPATENTIEVLIETRGEGGMVIVAPSGGTVHPTGNPWTLARHATPGRIITLSAEERDGLHAISSLLDEMPVPAPEADSPPFTQPTGRTTNTSSGGIAPGTDYNERGVWEELLTPHGWRVSRRFGDRIYWIRPGKSIGISAVTGGDAGDYFWA